MARLIALLILLLLPLSPAFAEETPRFTVVERSHTLGETVGYIGAIYGLNLVGYAIHQPKAIAEGGSFANYRRNFGKVATFDYDLWTYNWGIHVYTGSQAYLFYRARSYSKIQALTLTAIQSALFEFTGEIFTEPASLEDIINTPILGSALGGAIESFSLEWINGDSAFLRVIGHILNPTTILGLHEGDARLVPVIEKDKSGVALRVRF